MFHKLIQHIKTETECQQLAASFAPHLQGLSCIYLEGDLGLGKTTWVRGLLAALGHEGSVKSPTFSLIEIYEVNPYQIIHLDCYRINSPEEIRHLGLADYFSQQTIYLIEWPRLGASALPPADLILAFKMKNHHREITISAETKAGENFLKEWNPD